MKKFFVILSVLLMARSAFAADSPGLAWDASTGIVKGYEVHYTDGENHFVYLVSSEELKVNDIKNTLNLHYGKTYTFILKAWNNNGVSGPSNEVEYIMPATYIPPVMNIPVKQERPTDIIIKFIFEGN